MRHRIIGNISTGMGNPEPVKLDNKWSDSEKLNALCKKMFEESWNTFKQLKDYGGNDFQIKKNGIAFGIEPSYIRDPLFIVYIDFKKMEKCYIERGTAFGYYGTHIVSKKTYFEKTKLKIHKNFLCSWFDKFREANKK